MRFPFSWELLKQIRKTAFITGATGGIGREIAREFAKHDIRLILCGRRKEHLSELQQELSSHVKF